MEKQEIEKRNQFLLKLMLSAAEKDVWRRNEALINESLKALGKGEAFRAVDTAFIVGQGTSYATACNGETYLSRLAGLSARAVTAFELSRYPEDYLKRPANTLVIGVSCSGNTVSVVKALEAARAAGAVTVCLSGEGELDGAKAAAYRVITDCAIERRGEDSHPYSISHLFLLEGVYRLSLLIGLARGSLTAADAKAWTDRFEEALDVMKTLPTLYARVGEINLDVRAKGGEGYVVLGSGPNRGTRVEGALKICEYSWRLGAGEELEDFAHGRFRELDTKTPLLIISPDGPACPKTMDVLAACAVAHSTSVVFTDAPTPAMRKLATYIVEMPKLHEYLTPFVYIFAFWFYGFHTKADAGELVGEARYGLYATDVNFEAHFDADGNRR
jgi:glucosamine 6-phosphate synthetase-like amidotransferase/phosphosugar isomerase protein